MRALWKRLMIVAILTSCLALLFTAPRSDAIPSRTPTAAPVADLFTSCLAGMSSNSWKDLSTCPGVGPNTHLSDVVYAAVTSAPFPGAPGTSLHYYDAIANVATVGGCSTQYTATIFTAWNSGIYDSTDKAMVFGNGGAHQTYDCTEMYWFRFPVLQWERLSDPSGDICTGSAGCTGPVNCSTGVTSDGSPWPKHQYGAPWYNPDNNSYNTLGAHALSQNAGGCSAGDGPIDQFMMNFNLTTKVWSIAAKANLSMSCWGTGAYGFPWADWDPVSHKAIMIGNDQHCNGTTWNPHNVAINQGFSDYGARNVQVDDYHVTASIRAGHYLVTMGHLNVPTHDAPGITITQISSGTTTISTTNDQRNPCLAYAGPGNQGANGLAWDSVKGVFWSFVPGTHTVCELAPDTWVWTNHTAGGDMPLPDGNHPSADAHGVFGRFRYASNYDALVYAACVRCTMYAYKK